jgi:DNA processing protein
MIKGRDILVWLSIKYEGDWNSIYQAIKNKELVDEVQVTKAINDIQDSYVTIIDENYPEKLKKIYKPPFVLYYHGNLELINEKILAISGKQKASEYTFNLLDKLLKDMKKGSKDIIPAVNSVDEYESNINAYYNKKFVVVLPKSINQYSMQVIFRSGLIISEYPYSNKFNEANVPWSDRLLAGISDGVLVTEMPKKHHTAIVVGYGLYHGKAVGVFPQQNEDGTTQLAKDGALLVSTVEEVKLLLQSKPNNTEPVEVPTHA